MVFKKIESVKKKRFFGFSELISYKELLKSLIARDIKLKYTQTFLGVGWVILQPLVTLGVFFIIFGKWIQLDAEGSPYILFAFCGLIPWTFISQGLQRATLGIYNDRVIINKIYFPRLIIPLSALIVSLIDVAILLSILGALLKILGFSLEWKMLYFPLCLFPLFCFTLGLGALFSSLSVRYRDVLYLLPFFLQVFMYLSPVFYSTKTVPQNFAFFYRLNPMVGIIDSCRWCFLKISDFPHENFLIATGVSLVICMGGLFVFSKLQPYFADWL